MALRRAEWLLMQYAPRGSAAIPIGIALYVHDGDELHFRFRADKFMKEQDADVLEHTHAVFESIAADLGARKTFEWLGASLSNTIFAEGPVEILTEDPSVTVNELYGIHVESRGDRHDSPADLT